MDYRINKVGGGWEFLPQKEKELKSQYERLLNNINRREKRIPKEIQKVDELKKELREWKKNRTSLYHQLLKYHKELTPTFSMTLSKNKKIRQSYEGEMYTSGNRSWTITIRVGGKPKPIYLGTVYNVNKKLDEIDGTLGHWTNMNPLKIPKHEEIIKSEIEKVVFPLIKRDMKQYLEEFGNLDSYFDKTIKGFDYLEELYNLSDYSKVETKKLLLPKGKFVTYNPGWVKKK